MKYFVKYRVSGFAPCVVGPYAGSEINYHANDIKSFDGVLWYDVVAARDDEDDAAVVEKILEEVAARALRAEIAEAETHYQMSHVWWRS